MSSPTERPRERIIAWALYRVGILTDFAQRNCKNPVCGTKDDEGEYHPCSGKDCGGKLIAEHHRQELQAMRDMIALVEWLERAELEKQVNAKKRR